MALTFPFRGPIPDWLNRDTDGHRYWKPAEIPVQFVGRTLLDGASAIYAFAPEKLRHDLEIAWDELRPFGVSPLSDHREAITEIEYLHRNSPNMVAENTPDFRAFCNWKTALNIIRAQSIYPALSSGSLSAFGELGTPDSTPHWITPLTWRALEADPVLQGKFSGHDLVFWNVRVVSTREIIERDEKQRTQPTTTKSGEQRRTISSKEVENWFKEYKERFINAPYHPSLAKDLEAAREELHNNAITRSEIESLRNQLVDEERRPIGRRPNSPR